mmetsp:Transcript_12999/g.23119  ORF Transcript_12999/g.23119 Transcript_12999/m.23119 type:complete len:441 (-) Transcript_12999:620-1942(-)|eukprot:CAMPEP_0175073186 /NCGR_PEP_ID=MMETSP0052_2-20121109/20388_1 /TAXON_ID=51329 ORGANISM="Polytomella parva, Strain SAG 63-3" /NCGR_SAMPLE_ID=MMETSP0052_2 /ASSEMBLY_ACC=CAM_ASM_000194 /LENGTH=440 /DNA_ID=CAMNT_0016340899 /DNA_START=24 /DNA_END=1346 /DNA_ORIENTATION=-
MSTSVPNSETSSTPYVPLEILDKLSVIPKSELLFSSQNLKQSIELQREVLKTLRRFRTEPESVTLVGADVLLLQFLKNVYHLVSSLPGTLRFDALEDTIAKSELARPFLGNMAADGSLEVGYPSEENALCDTVGELVRVAAAAVICYYHYTNFPGNTDSIGSDEGCLIFASLALRSITGPSRAATVSSVEAELASLSDDSIMTLNEIAWLMHFFRGTLLGLYAKVHAHMGKPTDQRDSLIAQQSDFLSLVKRAPENPMGYSLYARACLQFQQHKAAYVFATKGVVIAEHHRAQWHRAQLLCEQAVALALGGGPSPADSDAPTGEAWRTADATAMTQQALAALKDELCQLPEVYHDLIVLEPGPELIGKFLLPKAQEVVNKAIENKDGAVVARATEGIMPVVPELYPTVTSGPLPLGAMTLVNGPSPAITSANEDAAAGQQ